MSKLVWQTSESVRIDGFSVPTMPNLAAGYHQGAGVKHNSRQLLAVKRLVWPFAKWWSDLTSDGFIDREAAHYIAKYWHENTVFLEVGCGDMSMYKRIPKNSWYNAFDLELSEFQMRRMLKKKFVNIAIASATEIPLDAGSVDLIVATETFEHIPEISKAIDEIHRIASPHAHLICSIPNNYCVKYQKKGQHPGHVNKWHYREFIAFMEQKGFTFIEGKMIGWWMPLPLWMTTRSYQLPITSANECDNTNFFFVFSKMAAMEKSSVTETSVREQQ